MTLYYIVYIYIYIYIHACVCVCLCVFSCSVSGIYIPVASVHPRLHAKVSL